MIKNDAPITSKNYFFIGQLNDLIKETEKV